MDVLGRFAMGGGASVYPAVDAVGTAGDIAADAFDGGAGGQRGQCDEEEDSFHVMCPFLSFVTTTPRAESRSNRRKAANGRGISALSYEPVWRC